MKKLLALLVILALMLSACARPDTPDEPQNLPAGSQTDQPAEDQPAEDQPAEDQPAQDQPTVDAPAEEQPEEKKPQIDPDWKDPSITEEQRRWFYDLAREYRVDAMALYGFEPGKPMDLQLFAYYCAYFMKEEDKTYVDMGVNYSGKAVEEIAKRFGVTYGLKDDDQVFVKAGSLLDIPFIELVQYREEVVDGKTLVTARCINYWFNRYNGDDRVESRETYPADRAMILKGKVEGYDGYEVIDISFYTEDGKTPSQFVSGSCIRYYSIEDGSMTVSAF